MKILVTVTTFQGCKKREWPSVDQCLGTELNINEDVLNECGSESGKETERKILQVEREEQCAKSRSSKKIKSVQGLEQACLPATLSTWPVAGPGDAG